MSKMKIKKSILRRVKITSTGKVLHASNFNRHLARNKSASQKRRLSGLKEFEQKRSIKIKHALGVA